MYKNVRNFKKYSKKAFVFWVPLKYIHNIKVYNFTLDRFNILTRWKTKCKTQIATVCFTSKNFA